MAEIPKIVGKRLQASVQPGEHPDANLLSALQENSLGGRERVQLLGHVSQCASCREVLLLSAPEPQVVGAAAPAGARWHSWPVLRWGTVAACIALVVAVVAMHPKQQTSELVARVAAPAAPLLPTA